MRVFAHRTTEPDFYSERVKSSSNAVLSTEDHQAKSHSPSAGSEDCPDDRMRDIRPICIIGGNKTEERAVLGLTGKTDG